MTKRIINKVLIKALVKEMGIAQTAVAANCSTSLIQKLMQDEYETIPAIRKIDGLCFAFKKDINELFPVSEAEEKSA